MKTLVSTVILIVIIAAAVAIVTFIGFISPSFLYALAGIVKIPDVANGNVVDAGIMFFANGLIAILVVFLSALMAIMISSLFGIWDCAKAIYDRIFDN